MIPRSPGRSPYALVVIPAAEDGPDGEWVPVVVDLDLAQQCRVQGIGEDRVVGSVLAALETDDGLLAVPSQFDRDEPGGGPVGRLVLLLPASAFGSAARVRIYFTEAHPPGLGQPASPGAVQVHHVGKGTHVVANEFVSVTHERGTNAGLPKAIRYLDSGKVLHQDYPHDLNFELRDMLIQPETGEGYALANDDAAELTVSAGHLCVTVRIEARYLRTPGGKAPRSNPRAVVEFLYFAGTPVVHVRAWVEQDHGCPWEGHFLWFRVYDEGNALFDHWQVGVPRRAGAGQAASFEEHEIQSADAGADAVTSPRAPWGALVDSGTGDCLGYLGLGNARLHDAAEPADYSGPGDSEFADAYYLRGQEFEFSGASRQLDGALWIGPNPGGAEALQTASSQYRASMQSYVTTALLESRLADLRDTMGALEDVADRGRYLWVLNQTERRLRDRGMLAHADEIATSLEGALAAGAGAESTVDWFDNEGEGTCLVDNGTVGLGLSVTSTEANRIELLSLFDLVAGRELLCGTPQPLWSIEALVPTLTEQEWTPEQAPGLKGTLTPGQLGQTGARLRGLVPVPEPQRWPRHATWPAALHSDDGFGAVEVTIGGGRGPRRIQLDWVEPVHEDLAGIAVRVQVQLEGGQTRWSLEVEDLGGTIVRHVRFPEVWVTRVSEEGREDRLLYPAGPGISIANPVGDPEGSHRTALYPSHGACMQMMAFYSPDGGLYAATHDPLASIKEVAVEPGQLPRAGRDGLRLTYRWPVQDMDTPGNAFSMSHEVPDPYDPDPDQAPVVEISAHGVLAVFQGDWFDAAQLYRKWAQTAPWWPDIDVDGRIDTPAWFKEIALWLLVMRQAGEDAEGWTPDAIAPPSAAQVVALTESFGLDAGVVGAHVYGWMRYASPATYPFLFPAEDGFDDFLTGPDGLQSHGIPAIPYLNGRLCFEGNYYGTPEIGHIPEVDRLTPSERVEFPVLEESGGLSNETYQEGRYLEFVLCPHERGWQELLTGEVARELLDPPLDSAGLYLDQIAAAEPALCFNDEHSSPHPLGGGHWWTLGGYWPLVRAIRAIAAGSGAVLTTECTAEPYLHLFDGLVVWLWGGSDEVPLFPAVYGEAAARLGRTYHAGADPWGAIGKAGQSFVWGEQIGWFKPGDVDPTHQSVLADDEDVPGVELHFSGPPAEPPPADPVDRAALWTEAWNGTIKPFLRRLTELRQELWPYLGGEMQRPPEIRWPSLPWSRVPPTVTSLWNADAEVTAEAIQRGAWRDGAGNLLLVMANISVREFSFELEVGAGDYELEDQEWAQVVIHGSEGAVHGKRQVPFTEEITLSGPDAYALEIRPTRPWMRVRSRGIG